MSWQDRERERYEGMLAERWGVDGKRAYSAVPQGVPVVYGHPEHGINMEDLFPLTFKMKMAMQNKEQD